jgi:hypothetical protein
VPEADIAVGEPAQPTIAGRRESRRSPLPKTDRLNCENNLAGRSGLKDLLVCSRGLGEWQYLADNGPQSAYLEYIVAKREMLTVRSSVSDIFVMCRNKSSS